MAMIDQNNFEPKACRLNKLTSCFIELTKNLFLHQIQFKA